MPPVREPREPGGEAPDSESDDEEREWLLGFVEPPKRRPDLLRHRFPSKVGGRPAWLHPLALPTPPQLTCRVTGEPLEYLLQVYAPLEADPAAFHRTLFLFISPQGDKLAVPGAVRALRCQLPRENPFYPPVPPKKSDVLPPGFSAEGRAAAAARDRWRVADYEHQLHQMVQPLQQQQRRRQEETEDRHQLEQPEQQGQQQQQPQQEGQPASRSVLKAAASDSQQQQVAGAAQPAKEGGRQGQPLPSAAPAVRLFPEAELVVEPEGEDDEGDGPGERDAQVRQLVEQYKQQAQQYNEEELPGSLVDELEGGISQEQRHFAAFAAWVAREPAQCLRYCFQPGARPIWPSPKGMPGAADIPPCEHCGAERRFEFQVMPQLINHLDVDASDPQAPDWGMIAVYSCTASCVPGVSEGGSGSADDSAYVEEFVWVQASA